MTAVGHVVMWRLHDPTDAAAFRAELQTCADLVPGTLCFEVGIRTERLVASCDVVLVSRFTDEATLRAYLDHPIHQAVSARLTDLRAERHQLDYSA